MNYVKTANGDELLTKTSIISEEFKQERVKKQKKFQIPMSDENIRKHGIDFRDMVEMFNHPMLTQLDLRTDYAHNPPSPRPLPPRVVNKLNEHLRQLDFLFQEIIFFEFSG